MAGAAFGDVVVSLLVAGTAFGDVGVSLFRRNMSQILGDSRRVFGEVGG